MSFWSRLKFIAGGDTPPTVTIPAGSTSFSIPEYANQFYLTAPSTVTIGTINANSRILPGRVVYLIGAASTAAITLTNNAGTTTKGQIDAGAADLTVDDQDVVVLVQVVNGTWLEVSSADN